MIAILRIGAIPRLPEGASRFTFRSQGRRPMTDHRRPSASLCVLAVLAAPLAASGQAIRLGSEFRVIPSPRTTL